MRLRNWLQRGRWPQVTHNGPPVPGEVKRLSIEDLKRLTATADAKPGWSATGRRAWLIENAPHLESAFMSAYTIEEPGVLRCVVSPSRVDGSLGAFTLDVSRSDFDQLPTISRRDSVELLHRLLHGLPVIPLDSDDVDRQ